MPRIQHFIFIIVFSILLLANSSQHPTNPNGGYTGAPLDSACNQCHSRTNSNLSGSFNIEGLPDIVFEGIQYPLKITISNPGNEAVQAGFQVVAINNSLINAGDLSSSDEGVLIKSARGRKYAGHSPAKSFNQEGIAEWEIEWIAGKDTSITLYGVGMIGNGKDGNSGDRPIFRQWDLVLKDTSEAIVGKIIKIKDIDCAGENNAFIEIGYDGGTPPVAITWENGDTNKIREDLTSGNYSVTLTDLLGNSDTIQITIESPPILHAVVEILSDVQPGMNNGAVSSLISGGTPPYYIEWYKDNNLFDTNKDTIIDLEEGNYALIVTDDNGCIYDTAFIMGNTSSIKDKKSSQDFILFPHPIHDHFSITGEFSPEAYNIYNMNGDIIERKKSINEVNHISLNPGIYLLELISRTNQKTAFIKIIVY